MIIAKYSKLTKLIGSHYLKYMKSRKIYAVEGCQVVFRVSKQLCGSTDQRLIQNVHVIRDYLLLTVTKSKLPELFFISNTQTLSRLKSYYRIFRTICTYIKTDDLYTTRMKLKEQKN